MNCAAVKGGRPGGTQAVLCSNGAQHSSAYTDHSAYEGEDLIRLFGVKGSKSHHSFFHLIAEEFAPLKWMESESCTVGLYDLKRHH